MTEDDIKQIFFVECEEALEAAESGLAACREGTHDAETINAIFRAVHSVKGGAGAFGHTALAAYTHGFENLLGEIREGLVPLEPGLVDLLLLALDCLRDHVEAARGSGAVPDDAELLAKLEAAQAGGGGTPVPVPAPAPAPVPVPAFDDLDALLDELAAPTPAPAAAESALVYIRPHPGALTNGSEPLLWPRGLTDLGGTCEACDLAAVPAIEALAVTEGYLGWTFRMPGHVARDAVAEIFDFVGDEVSVAYGPEGTMPPVRIIPSAVPATSADTAPAAPRTRTSAPASPAAVPSSAPNRCGST